MENIKIQYLILSAIACDILAVSMFTVASKSAFSASRHVLDEKRSWMTSETMEMLLCFKDWLDTEARLQNKSEHSTTSSDEDTNETDN